LAKRECAWIFGEKIPQALAITDRGISYRHQPLAGDE
jgi:hypothetical protein